MEADLIGALAWALQNCWQHGQSRSPFPHAVTQRTAATDHAVDVINNLPHLPRLVLLFAYCEGMSMREIGRALGVGEV